MSSSPISLSLNSAGFNSNSVIQQLMAAEQKPLTAMQNQEQSIQNRLDQYRTLNTQLSALQNSAKTLTGVNFDLSPFNAKSATSGNSAIFTSSADTAAQPGSYSVTVQQLAAAQKTGGGTFNAPTSAGSLRITDGEAGTSVDIAIPANASASDVAKAINNAKGGMTATVLAGKLVLTGAKTGDTYAVGDTAGGSAFAASLGIDSDAHTYQTAQKAIVSVDGQFTATSDSNTFTNAIQGVTINAASTGTTTLAVGQDTTGLTNDVQDLISKYNSVVQTISQNATYDANSQTGGVFLGDSFVVNLKSQLYNMVMQTVSPNASSGIGQAFDVGISVNKDGTLTLDPNRLNSALQNNPQAVYTVFANNNKQTVTLGSGSHMSQIASANGTTSGDGIAQRLSAFIDQMVSQASAYNPTLANGSRMMGAMANAMNTMQNQIDDYEARIQALNTQLSEHQSALQNEFSHMQTTVSQLQSQNAYFASQGSAMSDPLLQSNASSSSSMF